MPEGFCARFDWYLELFMIPSTFTKAPVPAEEKQLQSMMLLPPPCFTMETMNHTEEKFKKILRKKGLKQTASIEKCDAILVFCPVVSRAGTDIDAALEQLNNIKVPKPATVVVLHHTFDPEKIVPDCSRIVNRDSTLLVDCLFHEDKGLLKCPKNTDSIDRIVKYLKSQKATSYACLKNWDAEDTEDAVDRPLISSEGSDPEQNTLSQKWRLLCCRCCCCC
ncbi:uncharacterized protein LOC127429842 isoform X2 [Myxocyprinus asiaticus]|uniref:uncharacterized protein LOC127429842 isoform X2 n=1 Tax=Myxocyprinus asiaticus TaxID=70543 RepID=UPI0022233C72|nr:uncharacterized protein LOC127429842 isoform X2 [Myxocyprinus asiaticus]